MTRQVKLWLVSSLASSLAFKPAGSRSRACSTRAWEITRLGATRQEPRRLHTKLTEKEQSRDGEIFDKLMDEARAIEHSALLGPAVQKQVLEARDLVDVVSEVISARLARATSGIMLPRDKLKEACARSLRDDPRLGADVAAIMSRDPAAISYIQTVMFFKGFHAVQAQRVSANFWNKGSMSSKHVALAIQNRVSELWAVDIHPAAYLGGGLLMDHATGIVIGETARVGENCTILHSVTLGGTGKERGDRHPKISDNVVLGAGATVLGNIQVGRGSTVGSQAVVTKDVPDGMTVVGLNKLLDPNISPARQDTVKQRYETWQYEVNGYSI